MYTGFIIYLSVFVLVMLLICSKTCRKVVAGAIIFAILLGVVVLPLHGAMAEKLFDEIEVSEFLSITPTIFEGEPCNIIVFDYYGTKLSWYEYGEFYPSETYVITIFNSVEVVDAIIKELPSGSFLFYFYRTANQPKNRKENCPMYIVVNSEGYIVATARTPEEAAEKQRAYAEEA